MHTYITVVIFRKIFEVLDRIRLKVFRYEGVEWGNFLTEQYHRGAIYQIQIGLTCC